MNPIFEMDFEIVNAHFRAWGVQLAGAIFAFDARVVHIFDVFRWGRVGSDGDGQVGCGAYGGVSHRAFEGVVRVVLLQALKSAGEPGRW